MASLRSAIRKADLVPGFEAAKVAGYDRVSVAAEAVDGSRFLTIKGLNSDPAGADTSPQKKWKARRSAS
ncbi:MAG: hypothetical protein R8G34_06605 [Paracoccaceae bacterium]|nr:hypothetical protein [Paracoccaceae bacterium]